MQYISEVSAVAQNLGNTATGTGFFSFLSFLNNSDCHQGEKMQLQSKSVYHHNIH